MARSARITPPPIAIVSQHRNTQHQYGAQATGSLPAPPQSANVQLRQSATSGHLLFFQSTTKSVTASIDSRRRRRKRTWKDFAIQQRERVQALQDAPPWLVSSIFHLLLMLALALFTFKSSAGTGLLLKFRQGADNTTPALAKNDSKETRLANLDSLSKPELASSATTTQAMPIKLANGLHRR